MKQALIALFIYIQVKASTCVENQSALDIIMLGISHSYEGQLLQIKYLNLANRECIRSFEWVAKFTGISTYIIEIQILFR